MNRRRLLLAVLAVVITPLVLLFVLSRDEAGEGGGGPLLGPDDAMRQQAQLPDTGPGETRPLTPVVGAADGDGTAADRAAQDAADLARFAHRPVRGRVVVADGGRVPRGLTVAVSLRRPPPALIRITDEIRDRDAQRPFELVPPIRDGAGEADGTGSEAPDLSPVRLAELTRVPVAADGSFELLHVPVGGGWLVVEDDWLYADPPVRIGRSTTFVEAHLVRGGILSGRVVDDSGRPAADARVTGGGRFDPWMAFDSASRMASLKDARTDAEGRYRMAPVPAGQALQIAAVPDDPRWQPGRAEVGPLVPGEERRLDVMLRRGGIVSGRVVDGAGQPLADAGVLVQRLDLSLRDVQLDDAGGGRERRARTDTEGIFRVDGLLDGSYRAVLDERGWRQARSAPLKVRAGLEAGGIELVAEEGLAIAGRVLGPDGAPATDARVTASRIAGMFDMGGALDRPLRRSAQTDEEGRFRIDGLDAGKLRLEAQAPGSMPARQELAAGTEDAELRLEPTVSLSGICVSTRDSEPVTAFRISLTPVGGTFNFANPAAWEERFESSRGNQAFEDREDGTFQIDGLKPGTYDVQVQADGYGRTELEALEIPKQGRRGAVVMLPPEARVTGRVLAASTGLPIDGAEVTTARAGMMDMIVEGMLGTAPRAMTGADGSFSLEGLGPGPLTLAVRHAAYRELGLPERVLSAGDQVDLGEIRLSVGAAVYGHVRDGLGNPVSGVTVLVSTPTGSTMKRAPSDADGLYRVQGLPPGTFNVMRTDFTMDMGSEGGPMDFMKDMVMQSVTLEENEEKEVELRVRGTSGTRVHGTVRSREGAVSGAMISLVPERGGLDRMAFGSTGSDGAYELTGVQPGAYVLQIVVFEEGTMGAGGQPVSPVLEQLAVAGEPELRRDVLLPSGVLHGRVESAIDGTPLADVRVMLHRRDEGRLAVGMFAAMDGRVGEAPSKADGSFRFKNLPAGSYEITAGGQNLLGVGETGWAITRVTDLSVSEDGPGFAVKVKMHPAGAVAGRVRDGAGRPLTGVGVWGRDPRGRWISTFSEIASDAAGRYQVASLEPGAWTLAFRDGSHALTLVRDVLVRAGETTDLDITLPPGVSLRLAAGEIPPWTLRITLIGPDGPVPTDLVALTELMATADEEGMVVVGCFLPGPYQLRVEADGVVLHDGPIVLSPGSAQHVVSLGTP